MRKLIWILTLLPILIFSQPNKEVNVNVLGNTFISCAFYDDYVNITFRDFYDVNKKEYEQFSMAIDDFKSLYPILTSEGDLKSYHRIPTYDGTFFIIFDKIGKKTYPKMYWYDKDNNMHVLKNLTKKEIDKLFNK